MSGAFPISTAKFETLGIKSIQNTIISKSNQEKNLQDKLIIKDLVLLLE